jgi:hypothetical protein
MKSILSCGLACAASLLGGCGHTPTVSEAVFASRSAVQTRQREERAFDTADRERTLRAVLATLQELGFVVDHADAVLGLITATKFDTYTLRATVTVRPRGAGQMVVRLNAQYALPRQTGGALPLQDPVAFQDFFAALSKSMFLAAQEVE